MLLSHPTGLVSTINPDYAFEMHNLSEGLTKPDEIVRIAKFKSDNENHQLGFERVNATC